MDFDGERDIAYRSEDEFALGVLVEELPGEPGDLLDLLLQEVPDGTVPETVTVPFTGTGNVSVRG